MRRDHTIPRGELHRLVHQSVVLQGNPLDDPTERELHVWTPPGWSHAERLPLLVDLTGYWGAGPNHTNWKPGAENVPERLDRLAHEGMARVVVAFPDCFTKLYGNQYLNSAGSGRYADYVCDEIVATVEAKFGCGGVGRRGVFGKSSGGYGAAWHGMNRADFWSAISINSGDMGFDALYIPALLDDMDLLRKHGNSIERFVRHVESQPKMKDKERMALMDFAQGAFYDPDPTQFRNMRLPLDPHLSGKRQRNPHHRDRGPQKEAGLLGGARQLRAHGLDLSHRCRLPGAAAAPRTGTRRQPPTRSGSPPHRA